MVKISTLIKLMIIHKCKELIDTKADDDEVRQFKRLKRISSLVYDGRSGDVWKMEIIKFRDSELDLFSTKFCLRHCNFKSIFELQMDSNLSQFNIY